MDLISTDGQTIIRTKAVRKIANQWDADLLLGMTDGPMDFFGHRQVKSKQKIIPLAAPLPQEVDEEAEAVRDHVSSERYSASEPIDAGEQQDSMDAVEAQAWEDAGLEHMSDAEGQYRTSGSGGAISPGMMVPVTPLSEVDEDADIPEVSHKHACSSPLANEGLKAQKMDDDPSVAPKSKAAKTEGNVNQIAEVEFCHNDEEMFDAGLEEFDLPDMDED
eukprot:s1251_g8.t1